MTVVRRRRFDITYTHSGLGIFKSVSKNYLLRPLFDPLVKKPKRLTPGESAQPRKLKMEGYSIVNTLYSSYSIVDTLGTGNN